MVDLRMEMLYNRSIAIRIEVKRMTANCDIKAAAKQNGVHLWEVADGLGIADTTFSRKLRRELSDQDKAHVLTVIDEIAAAKQAQ